MQKKNSNLINHSSFLYNYELIRTSENKTFNKIDNFTVMKKAARACYLFIKKNFKYKKILVLCGLGNNGGDGIIIANHLLNDKNLIDILFPLGKPKSANAIKALSLLKKKHCIKKAVFFKDYDIIIDALFGIGFNKKFNKKTISLIKRINSSNAKIISIDIPSGVFIDSGAISNVAIEAHYTLSLHRYKPGNWLLPGKKYCGNNILLDIGLENLDQKSYIQLNTPQILPKPNFFDHKYSRGICFIVAGKNFVGASKLTFLSASQSILRGGAGVCKLLVHVSQKNYFKSHIMEEMILSYTSINNFKKIIKEQRCNSLIFGCGIDNNLTNKTIFKFLLKQSKNLVLDAAVFSMIQENRNEFIKILQSRSAKTVMTPHIGEFKRVYKLTNYKINDCIKAAIESNAVIVLKGNDTIIGSKNGLAYINTHTSSYLATAGSGDVLAGLIGSFLAQGLESINAARLGCYIHSQCGINLGKGLIASDLIKEIPNVMKKMK